MRRVAAVLVGLVPVGVARAEPRQEPSSADSLAASAAELRATREALLAADRSLSDSTAALGPANGLARGVTEDVVYLHPGAPLVRGREDMRRLLSVAAAADPPERLEWLPLHGDVSSDGRFGYTYGVTVLTRGTGAAGEAAPRGGGGKDLPPTDNTFGKYISVWRREGEAWKLAANAQIHATDRESARRLLEGLGRSAAEAPFRPVPPPSETAAALYAADSSFAVLGQRAGLADAFATYAAPDAAMFPTSGEIARGPDAIRELYADWPPTSTLTWQPVVGAAAASGDLGYTVGQWESRGQGPNGEPSVVRGKYLTVWRKQPNGSWKYVTDGGNVGPPAGPGE